MVVFANYLIKAENLNSGDISVSFGTENTYTGVFAS